MPNRTKTYVTSDGGIIIVDPTISLIPLIKKYKPDFTIDSAPSPVDFLPGFQRLRRLYVPDLDQNALGNTKDNILWNLHDRIMTGATKPALKGEISLLDMKVELTKREIAHCRLCGRECGVNRFQKAGRCGLMDEVYFSEPFVHIQEEAPITPAATIKLFGCSLSCIYCQAWEHLDVQKGQLEGKKLDQNIWKELEYTPGFSNAVSLEFVGGNPDENIYPILKTLQSAPPSFRFPLVWNSNLYATPVAYKLLSGIVDVFLPDLKYGSNDCGKRLSGIDDYWDCARKGLELMTKLPARIIVRILILPNHVRCCNLPVIEFLSRFRERIWVSVLDQYIPDYKAVSTPGMDRRPTAEEVKAVKEAVRAYELCEVTDRPALFWKEADSGR